MNPKSSSDFITYSKQVMSIINIIDDFNSYLDNSYHQLKYSNHITVDR